MANGAYDYLATDPFLSSQGVAPYEGDVSFDEFGGAVYPVDFASSAAGAVTMVRSAVSGIVLKIQQSLGRRISAVGAVALIRQLGRNFPIGVVAGFLGISLLEVLTLLASKKRRRRMNPANTRALRRSLRRLDSFARLSSRVMAHRSAFRRPGARRIRCNTCRKSPCSC